MTEVSSAVRGNMQYTMTGNSVTLPTECERSNQKTRRHEVIYSAEQTSIMVKLAFLFNQASDVGSEVN